MEFRILNSDDAQAYWDLRLEALEREKEAFSSSPEEHLSLRLDEVKRRLGADPSFFIVGACEGGWLVGTAGFYREKGRKSHHKGRVWGVYVTGEMRGKAVGRNLLKALLEKAEGIDGVEQILLAVAATQAAAKGLYRSLGFKSYGCEPRALKIGDRYIDEEYMVLFLARSGR